jgi:hypothetical protein
MARTPILRRHLPAHTSAFAFAVLCGLSALAPAGAATASAHGGAAKPADGSANLAGRGAPALEARGLSVGAPVARVYRSEDAAGRVVFGDQPEPGARSVEVRTFASSSDPQARETARRQQAYWRAQAAGIAERRKAREEAERQALAEAQRAAESRPLVLIVPQHLRAPWLGIPPVQPPQGGFAPVYPSSPGAAAGAPAAFIGSGFSTAR